MDSTTTILRRLIEGGLSQTEIARRTGIPQPRLSRWADGSAPSAADDALKLLKLSQEVAPPAAEEARNAA